MLSIIRSIDRYLEIKFMKPQIMCQVPKMAGTRPNDLIKKLTEDTAIRSFLGY